MLNSITPTKENPTFIARCNWNGNIYAGYKDSIVETNTHTSEIQTFALSFAEAVTSLIEYAKQEKEYLLSEKNTKLFIELVDGSFDSDGEVKYKRVFTLTSTQIKLL